MNQQKQRLPLFLKDICLFIRIARFIAILPFLLRFSQLSSILRLSFPGRVKIEPLLIQEEEKRKIIKFTDFLLGFRAPIFRSTCLKRSLVLFKFLREIGVNVVINFGVSKYQTEEKLKLGHAWLTFGGMPVFSEEPLIESYRLCYIFPEETKIEK